MNNQALHIVFAGTTGFAALHLHALLENNYHVGAVYTQPDRPAGRGKKLRPSPVKQLAIDFGIPVFQPDSLKTSEQQELLRSLKIDLMVVVAYGLLLPQAVLDIPHYGCINVHASLLPRWRGAAPIERAILAGDSETGITIMQMDAGLDTGDILFSLSTPIEPHDNSETVSSRLAGLGCQGLLETLDLISIGKLTPTPQDNTQSTYAEKLSTADAQIIWNRPAQEIQRQIAAFYPRSPGWTYINEQRIRIIQSHPDVRKFPSSPGTIVKSDRSGLLVSCKNSSLLIEQMQLSGKNPNKVAEILNSHHALFSVGSIFKGLQASIDED
jgi:methionyl-tRNA formyltransferase